MLGRACGYFPVSDCDRPFFVSSFFFCLENDSVDTCACRTKWTVGATMFKSANGIFYFTARHQLTVVGKV